jgi:predicted metal-binding membrane protein
VAARETRPGAAASLARSERAVTGAGLLALTLLSWLYLALLADSMDAMDGAGSGAAFMALMPMGRWAPAEFALCFAMWLVMMIAMMVPSAAPMLLAFLSFSRSRAGGEQAGQRFAAFLLGYLLVWAAFSAVATGAQWALREASLVTDLMASASSRLNGVLLIGAGLYQFAAAKQVCLARCRSPLAFVLMEWRAGSRGALVMGLRHGGFCVGCCWGLMALLFVGGVMNLLWIAVLSAVVLAEKLLPFGAMPSKIAGAAMVACGLWLL